MKKKLLFVLVYTLSISSFSQNKILSDFVKDSLQNHLPYANVIAKSKDVF